MATLTVREIYDVARAAGFTPEQAVTWTSIAFAESRGRTTALNDHGEHSVGLWQINLNAHKDKYGDLRIPANNAKAAYEISHQGTDMRPWTTTHDINKGTGSDYRHYLKHVEDVIGVQGDPRGVHGYYSKLPPPLQQADTKSAHDTLATGNDLAGGNGSNGGNTAGSKTTTPQADPDHDGLTTEFENLIGSDPNRPDTDKDGLLDGFEAAVSHTDPLSFDTDGDGITDPRELAAHSDPGRLPGVGGVVGTGVLAENVRNGVEDLDHDGLSNRTERLVGTDPQRADSDGDGLPDAMEASLGTNPTLADTDRDGIIDPVEVRNGTDPLAGNGAGTKVQPWTLDGAAAEHATLAQSKAEGAAVKHSTIEDHPQESALGTFLKVAEAQVHDHDHYRMGATPKASDKNPSVFDCSSFTQWSAHQAGFELDRTAEEQYMQLKKAGLLIKVEDAIHTPGALMFSFSSEPTRANPRPWHAHVVISNGRGRTFEAKGHAYGVGSWPATGGRFQYAAVIPGISDKAGQQAYADELASKHGPVHTVDPVTDHHPTDHQQPTDHGYGIDSGKALTTDHLPGGGKQDPDPDHDGLTTAFEKLAGTNPNESDTDGDGLPDGYEATTSHTDPLKVDSDNDGQTDWLEIQYHTDPLSPASNLASGLAGGLPGGGLPGSGLPGSGLPGSGLPGSGFPGSGLPGGGSGGVGTELSGAGAAGTPAHGDATEILDLG